MKNIFYFLCFTIILLSSCETKFSELEYQGASFVMHKDTIASVDEGSLTLSDTAKLQVLRASSDASQALTISFQTQAKYKVTGADAANTFTAIGEGTSSNTLVIPAGKFEATIKIVPIGNNIIDAGGSREVSVTLTSVNAGFNIGYPGNLAIGRVSKLTIEDDDCPFNVNTFTGNYSTSLFGLSTGRHTTKFIRGSGNNVVNVNFNNYNIPINYTVSSTGTGSVTIPLQFFNLIPKDETLPRRYGVRSPAGSPGFFSVCSGKMTVPFEIFRTAVGVTTGDFSFFDDGTHVFVK